MRAQNGDLNEWVDDSTEYLLQELSKNLAVIKNAIQPPIVLSDLQ